MALTASAAIENSCSEEEWMVRQDLAACYRAFVHYGWTDLIYTHLSARVPGYDDQYLINPYGLLFHEIKASSLIKVTFDGEVIAGDYPYNSAGHAIHTAILKARPDVNVVLHSHTRAGAAVSCMSEGLLPMSQHANEVLGYLCYHDYDVATDNEHECEMLGKDMGQDWSMIMRNHGLLTAGRNVAEAFYHMYYPEMACKIQVDVMASGAEVQYPPKHAQQQLLEEGMPEVDGPGDRVNRPWAAVIRMLDEKDPDYRN